MGVRLDMQRGVSVCGFYNSTEDAHDHLLLIMMVHDKALPGP